MVMENCKLLKCESCGKIYKIVDEVKGEHVLGPVSYITDLGGILLSVSGVHYINCVHCINCDAVSQYDIIECENWVADKVFEVKGS